jgi:hypothetical protein
MPMANGTATQQEGKLRFKPRKTSTEQIPDAPEGEWEALIPKGKCKFTVTQNGDPRIIIPFKLVKAEDEKNETYQNSEVNLQVIIFDDEDNEKRRAANMSKGRLRALCEACDIVFGDVYPSEVSTEHDFDKLFAAVEGKKVQVWTVHTTYTNQSNETVQQTEIRFKEPGAGLVTKGVEADDDDGRPGKAKRTKRR